MEIWKNKAASRTRTTGGHRMGMMEVVFTTTATRPDCLLFTCPALFGNTQPQLTCHSDGTAPSPKVNRRMSILRIPRNETS